MAGETYSDDVDPWAPGGTMSAGGGAPPRIPLSFDAVDEAVERRPARRRQFIVGALAVASLAAAASVVVTGDRDVDDERPAASALLPPASSDESAPSTQSTSGADEPPNPPGLSIRPPFPGEAMTFVGAQANDVITIARDLSEIAPTQIVALHDDLGLYELSLPSGLLRITDLGFEPTDARLTVNDGVAVVWPTPEGGYHVIGANGSATSGIAPLTAVASAPGSDRMYLWTSMVGVRGTQTLDIVAGGFELTPADWVEQANAVPGPVDPGGALLQADTGGTYRITEDGAELVTTGDVIAVGRNHVLLRECLPDRTCSLITLSPDGSRTAWTTDLPDRVNPQSVSGLAPSGDAVLIAGERFSADTPRELQVLELVDGSITTLRASPEFDGVGSWASDSSGIFFSDAQLLFIGRRTGETIVVSEELPAGLRSIQVRVPNATPICELLSITQARFDVMRATADESAQPPNIEVLTRIVEIGPPDLSRAAAPLVTFIEVFVSRSTRGSLTVSNWPGEEREGLDALDSYHRDECTTT